jgi:hypothetical protein
MKQFGTLHYYPDLILQEAWSVAVCANDLGDGEMRATAIRVIAARSEGRRPSLRDVVQIRSYFR